MHWGTGDIEVPIKNAQYFKKTKKYNDQAYKAD